MSTQSKNLFGCMGMNLAAAIGVKQAEHTVDTATKTLDQQCHLQEEMAKELGGVGKNGNEGLIEIQFNYQMESAQSSCNAIQDEANGALASAIVGTVGTLASGTALFKDWKNEDVENSLNKATGLKGKLNVESEKSKAEVTRNPTLSAEAIDEQIARWKGSATKEADFSSLGKDESLDNAAIAKIKNDANSKEIINRNLEKHINDLNLRMSSERTSKQNSYVNAIGQATNAGSGFANYGGMTDKAVQNEEAQQESAYANIVQNAEQTVDAQMKTAGQAAGTYQQEISSILQGIAFPA